jgi:hypothetical protein
MDLRCNVNTRFSCQPKCLNSQLQEPTVGWGFTANMRVQTVFNRAKRKFLSICHPFSVFGETDCLSASARFCMCCDDPTCSHVFCTASTVFGSHSTRATIITWCSHSSRATITMSARTSHVLQFPCSACTSLMLRLPQSARASRVIVAWYQV